ncbi:MAG: hypothetical protein UT26_C0022G0001, partial [Microgenomates group bacterium GW2011_GWC1_39_12]
MVAKSLNPATGKLVAPPTRVVI